jgi:hypothetical protein
MSSLVLNEKGTVAYQSTFSPLLDLFSLNTVKWGSLSFTEFTSIVGTCQRAYSADPDQYVRLVKYRRSIAHLGQKMMYYVMITVLRLSNPDEYKAVLQWTHACKKDLFRLSRIYRMAGMSGMSGMGGMTGMTGMPGTNLDLTDLYQQYVSDRSKLSSDTQKWLLTPNPHVVPIEIEQIVNEVVEHIGNNNNDTNLLFKYIGTDHFSIENMMVRRLFNMKRKEAGLPIFSNSQFRLLFTREKQKLHLFDTFLQGFKEDRTTPITCTGNDREYIVSYLKKMSTIAFQNAKQTISAFAESAIPYQQVLYQAYCDIEQEVKQKTFTVKAIGINPVEKCYHYWQSEGDDIILEGTLDTKLKLLREKLGNVTPALDIVIDNSGSMNGKPIQTAFYITTMLHRLFSFQSAVVFNSTADKFAIGGESWKDVIHSIYRPTTGSTNLETIFPLLENNSNTTLILTDGDCDPTSRGANPFQEALTRFPDRKFVVWNLKESKLHFPYCINDQRVGYLSGNDPSVISGVLQLLSKGQSITPIGLLNECVTELESPVHLPACLREMTSEEMCSLYHSVRANFL